jgi:hypothetical protein
VELPAQPPSAAAAVVSLLLHYNSKEVAAGKVYCRCAEETTMGLFCVTMGITRGWLHCKKFALWINTLRHEARQG